MLVKKLSPEWEEAIAVGIISQSEYNTALEQYNLLVLYAASNDVDVVEIPEEDVELRKIITIQTEQGLYSHYALEAIQEYLKGFVEKEEEVAPAGRYVLTYEEVANMYSGNYCTQLYFHGYPLKWRGEMPLRIAKEIVLYNGKLSQEAIPSVKDYAKEMIINHIRSMERKLEKLKDFKEFFQNL